VLTHSTAIGPFSATVPIVALKPRPKPKAVDVLDSIRERLADAKDFDDESTLFCLGIHLLRQRQLEQRKGGR
jgi:hypothetical protein